MPRPIGTDLDAQVLGALLVALPFLLGWAVGWALRAGLQTWGGWRRRLGATLAAAVPLLAALPAARAIPAVGSWDVILVCVWIALGVLLSALHRPTWRDRIALVVIPLTMLASLELLCRLFLPAPPAFPPPREARLVVSFSNRDPPCEAIFPNATGFAAERAHGLEDRPVTVVHVGDSMVAGNGVPPDAAFAALLNGRDPGVAHINSGTNAAGPEAHLLVAREWLARGDVDLTVVYVFMGNDLQDIDRAYTCCGMGPLLDWSAPEPRPRCEHLEWTFPAGVLLSTSPPPYPLRVAAARSAFAAYATAAFDAIDRLILGRELFNVNFGTWREQPTEERFAKLERILRALHDSFEARHAPLLVVVLPYRRTLERAHGVPPSARDVWETLEAGRAAEERVVTMARGLGLDVLDAYALFDAAITDGDVAHWFAHDYPGDLHFSAAGHQLLAGWLGPEIDRRLRASHAAPVSAQ